ncbi:hypothetical protein EMCRGX_G029521 [Ephydatia muelleri]
MAGGRSGYYKHVGLAVVLLLFFHEGVLCQPRLVTFRPTTHFTVASSDGIIAIQGGKSINLTLFGDNITNKTVLHLSPWQNDTACNRSLVAETIIPLTWSPADKYAEFSVSVDGVSSGTTLYFCLDGVHQGNATWKSLRVTYTSASSSLLPLPLQIILLLVLLCFSALFSGLNLGLMSLDPTTLKIIMKSGTRRQKLCARLIYRVRKYGNYLLCTILFGNVAVNSTITILLDDIVTGAVAVAVATLCIVIFGEIMPQAVCSRHGLLIGAATIWITYAFMFITFPVAFPLSLVLNFMLGKEVGAVYKRDQLLELLHVTQEHHDIAKDEVELISGVLGFKKKKAEDVMTKLENAYCLDIDTVLDFNKMREIYNSGYSRIPVYEGTSQNMVGLLYARDLAFIDADEATPLKNVLQFYNHTLHFVYSDAPLDELLHVFSEGTHHLSIVQRVVSPPSQDPYYEILGLVTLEDVLEEILQREIKDETDQFGFGATTAKSHTQKQADMGDFLRSDISILSSQQKLAALQFLSESVEAFSEKRISKNVLKKLLQKDIAREITQRDAESGDLYLYKSGVVANYFVLILEGCVEVTIGREGMSFEGRAFSCYGHQVLVDAYGGTGSQYQPDFTVRPLTSCVVLIVTYNQYVAALKATSFEQERRGSARGGGGGPPPASNGGATPISAPDHFLSEWQKAVSEDHNTERSKLATIIGVLHQKIKAPRRFKHKLKVPDKQKLLAREEGEEEKPVAKHLEPDTTGATPAVPTPFAAETAVVVMSEEEDKDFPVWFKSSGHPSQSEDASLT